MAFVYWVHLSEHVDAFSQGYVGITNRPLNARWAAHRRLIERGENPCRSLQDAAAKHGLERMKVTALVQGSPDYVRLIERRLRPVPFVGWNMGVGGRTTALGLKRSEETKARLNAAKVGRPRSEQCRANVSAGLKGNQNAKGSVRTRELREASSIRNRGYRHTDEAKVKIGAASRERWKNR